MKFNIKTSDHQGVDKNFKNIRRKQITTNKTHHAIITLLYWWHTHNGKGVQTNDTSIWIVINIFSVVILFNFHHAPSALTHRSLRLCWQQLFSLSNLLFPPFCFLQGSRIMPFVCHWKHLACIPSLHASYFFNSPHFHL